MNMLGVLRHGFLALALLCLGAFVAWQWQANRYNAEIASIRAQVAQDEAERSRVTSEAIAQEQQRNAQLSEALNQLEQRRFKEIQDVQNTAQRLTLDLSTARQRLSVRVVRPVCGGGVSAESPSGVLGNGAYTAELHPAVAADLAALAADADQCALKLAYLQHREQVLKQDQDTK
ncbi:lysis system i-spanin subunit Rz [Pseudomonas sp. NPDC087346]|uniref:lysis system i-spanin subunit Rz n=1 Tax=Pseudomonas sp. NPDC087346 TaxID=3364438 RepID=UPI003829C6B4